MGHQRKFFKDIWEIISRALCVCFGACMAWVVSTRPQVIAGTYSRTFIVSEKFNVHYGKILF